MCEKVSEWVSVWMSQWMGECMSQWLCVNEWEWVNEGVCERVDEGVCEWMSEWVNDWWISLIVCEDSTCHSPSTGWCSPLHNNLQQTVGCGPWDVGCGMWAMGCGLWAMGCGMWAVGCGCYPTCQYQAANFGYYRISHNLDVSKRRMCLHHCPGKVLKYTNIRMFTACLDVGIDLLGSTLSRDPK